MKFFAISAFISLGFLAQHSEASNVFASSQPTVQLPQPNFISSGPSNQLGLNEGFQNLMGALNFFGNNQNTIQPPTNTPSNVYTAPSVQIPSSQNLKYEPAPLNPPKFPGNVQGGNSIINPSQIWSKNPFENFDFSKLNIFDNFHRDICNNPRVWDGTRCRCPNNNIYMSGKCERQVKPEPKGDLLGLRSINRNFDGTENNLKNPEWGAKGSPLLRLCSPNYQDGKSQMWQQLPNPRQVSNLIGHQEGPVKQNKQGLNMLFTIWGQFLDHDITLTPTTRDQPMNIKVPKCDVFMDKKCTGTEQLQVTRSIHTGAQIRTNINVLTPWIDASQIYGSDKATADNLREFKNGKLKTSEGNLPPKSPQGGFLAGDFRIDQNVALTSFHVIFLREHNRLCDVILNRNPNLTDEEVFQIARNYVIGLVQHITFDEYLPELLGKKNFDQFIGHYKYDPTANPSIYTEFSSAGFRLGHPLINAPFKKMDNFGNVIDELQLGEMFFNPKIVTNESVPQFLSGLARTGAKQRSLELVDDLRNFLFFPPNAQVKIDLFSFNVQRGRDHGICSVEDARQKLGLPKKSFKEIFQNQYKAKQLQKLYHRVDNLDLWLAIIGEKGVSDSPLGELGVRLNAFQFQKIRNGDRFWYESAYPESVVREIKNTTFAEVIMRNSAVKFIGKDSFKKC